LLETYGRTSAENDPQKSRWQSKFTVIKSGECLALDCLFVAEFNEEGLCQIFREWWHIQDAKMSHTF
jgi:hypothetical protein